jgi:hypothetical protein
VGRIVHSIASRARNVVTLFFLLGWDQNGFNKNHAGHVMPNLCLHPVGSVGHVVHSSPSGAYHYTCVFASGGICGSHITF